MLCQEGSMQHVCACMTALGVLRRGLHFLVVQTDEDADTSAGLWLLQDRQLPSV